MAKMNNKQQVEVITMEKEDIDGGTTEQKKISIKSIIAGVQFWHLSLDFLFGSLPVLVIRQARKEKALVQVVVIVVVVIVFYYHHFSSHKVHHHHHHPMLTRKRSSH